MDPIISSSIVYCFALFLNTFEYIQNLVQVYSFWNPNVLYKGQSIPFSYFLPSLLVVVTDQEMPPGDVLWKPLLLKKILSCAYHSLGSTVPLRCQSSGSRSYSDTDYQKRDTGSLWPDPSNKRVCFICKMWGATFISAFVRLPLTDP